MAVRTSHVTIYGKFNVHLLEKIFYASDHGVRRLVPLGRG